MKSLQTITTIELSSICNLSCKYCINRLMRSKGRVPSIMDNNIFNQSLRLLAKLVHRGTQKEINLNGNGESTLDSQLVERVRRVKQIMGDGHVQFCTNGVALTKSLAEGLKNAGIDRIDLSVHDAYHARRCAQLLTKAGIQGSVNFGTIVATHNWAGQLEPQHQVPILPKIPCHPIIEGRGYIDSDGWIVPCCYDYQRLGAIGTVWCSDILERGVKPFSLCKTCHQTLPEGSNGI